MKELSQEGKGWSHSVHWHLMRMIEDGYLVVQSLSNVDGVHREEYLWVNPECVVAATLSLEFGRALWRAAEYWKLNTSKRYTRRSGGVLVDQELFKLLKEAIEKGQ